VSLRSIPTLFMALAACAFLLWITSLGVTGGAT
jgi:hypothetical protein